MLGCCRRAVARASRIARFFHMASLSGGWLTSEVSFLMKTSLPVRLFSALYEMLRAELLRIESTL
ncbi:hypothetical protein D3C86_759880 [compost metagenome]